MSQVYDRLRETASRLIDEFGRPAQFILSTRSLGDSSKPWGSSGDVVVESTFNANMVFTNEGSEDLEARLSAVSRLVLSPTEVSQSQVYVAAKGLGVVPSIDMEVLDSSRRLAIKKVQEIKPGPEIIMYVLTVEN